MLSTKRYLLFKTTNVILGTHSKSINVNPKSVECLLLILKTSTM